MPDQSFWVQRDSYWLPSSMPINVMTGKAIKLGLKGWEYFTGIPATLGGAIWMNAGTSLGEIGDLIKRVKILRRNGDVSDSRHKRWRFFLPYKQLSWKMEI